MTIRRYCDAAYTLILREYQRDPRAGMSLDDALERLKTWAAGHAKPEKKDDRVIAEQNQRSMQQLERMMAGL